MRERTLRCLKIALFAILFSGIALNLSNPAFLKRKESFSAEHGESAHEESSKDDFTGVPTTAISSKTTFMFTSSSDERRTTTIRPLETTEKTTGADVFSSSESSTFSVSSTSAITYPAKTPTTIPTTSATTTRRFTTINSSILSSAVITGAPSTISSSVFSTSSNSEGISSTIESLETFETTPANIASSTDSSKPSVVSTMAIMVPTSSESTTNRLTTMSSSIITSVSAEPATTTDSIATSSSGFLSTKPESSTSAMTSTTSVQTTISTTRTSCHSCDHSCSAIECLDKDYGDNNKAKCTEKGCIFCEDMPDDKPWCYYTEDMEIPGQNCHDCNCLERSPCKPDNENDCVNAGCHWCPKDSEHPCIYGNFQTQCTSCNCPSELKENCLPGNWYSDPEQECINRGCRWCPNNNKEPDCIKGPKPSEAECQIDNSLKKDCGYYGIWEPECRNSNCCWEEVDNSGNEEHGIPYCFYPSNFDY